MCVYICASKEVDVEQGHIKRSCSSPYHSVVSMSALALPRASSTYMPKVIQGVHGIW